MNGLEPAGQEVCVMARNLGGQPAGLYSSLHPILLFSSLICPCFPMSPPCSYLPGSVPELVLAVPPSKLPLWFLLFLTCVLSFPPTPAAVVYLSLSSYSNPRSLQVVPSWSSWCFIHWWLQVPGIVSVQWIIVEILVSLDLSFTFSSHLVDGSL